MDRTLAELAVLLAYRVRRCALNALARCQPSAPLVHPSSADTSIKMGIASKQVLMESVQELMGVSVIKIKEDVKVRIYYYHYTNPVGSYTHLFR